MFESSEIGMNTSWSLPEENIKITIKDVIKYLKDNNVPTKTINVDTLKPLLINQDYDNKNKNRVDKASLEYPIIIVKSNGKYKSILDGNHRLYKAIKNKAKNIKVQEIDLDSKSSPPEFKKLFDYSIEPFYNSLK